MTSFPPFQPAGPQLSLHSGVPPSLSADLEEFNIKSLDSAGDWGGISDSMGGSPSPPVGLSSFIFPPAFLSGGGGGVRTGGSCSIVKGSNRDVVPPGVPGFLWSPFLCSESFGRLASSPRSILPEQLHQRDSLSHGDGSLHQGISAGGGLGGIDRSFGRVFSYFGPQKGSKVPSFSMGGPDVSVLRSPIRAVSSPLGFYSSRSGVSASAEVIGDQNSCLLRRLADLGQQSGAVPTECGRFIGSSSVAGFPPKSAEIRSDTLAAICVPGDGFRHYFYDGGPFPGSASPSVSSAVSSGDTGVRFGQGPGLPPWSNGEPLYASAFGPCLEASLSACLPRSFPPSFSGLGFSGSSGGLVYRDDQKVERSLLSVSESAYPFPSGGYDSIHGCFRSEGLGGAPRSPSPIRGGTVVPRGPSPVTQYQPEGDGGCSSLSPSFSRGFGWQGSSPFHRQFVGVDVCQQTRGNNLGQSLDCSRKSASVVPGAGYSSVCTSSVRETEHFGGHAEQARCGSADRMDPLPSCPAKDMDSLLSSSPGSICNKVQSPSTSICVSCPRRGGLGCRCTHSGLVVTAGLCISSSCSPAQGSSESSAGRGLPHSGSSDVASTALVSRPASDVPRGSAPTEPSKRRPGSASHGGTSRKRKSLESSRLSGVQSSLKSLGASDHTLSYVRNAHRAGTNSVYESKWNRWLVWSESHKVDPLRPYAVQLANFLSALAAEDKLSVSTIKVFHSAIVSTLKQKGGRVRGLSSRPRLVTDVVKGIAASCAKVPRRIPLWDLFLVLEQLRSAPFEPLAQADKKFLTWKTVFLISLASGRRCSEVNGLSGLPRDLARLPDGAFRLQFLPEFRAKNQGALDPSPSVLIPPLTSILAPGDEDRLLCPVRALSCYLAVTAAYRPTGCRKLFISLNEKYQKDVSKNTVARWLSDTIKFTYEKAGTQLPSARAHEIRAWSASLAACKNVALKDILEAAFWKSEDTFINFYLRDCALERIDGTRGISSVVAAQRALPLR